MLDSDLAEPSVILTITQEDLMVSSSLPGRLPENAQSLGSGLVIEGFFWELPLKEVLSSHQPLVVLEGDRLERVRLLLQKHLPNLSSHGWYPGIPDRTLLLESDGVRLVYGGSMGDEVGVRSIDGKRTVGFFRSKRFVSLLSEAEER